MAKLIAVHSATATAWPGITDFILTVTMDDGGTGEQIEVPFTLGAEEPGDMSSQVNAWMAANPEFEVAPAPGPTADEVWSEKDRRWALGFDYDFGDARGVHHIGTTPKDLDDWNKVSTLAQAMLNSGVTNTPISISTDTGDTQVTPSEWQRVLIASGLFMQPIMQAAMTIVKMSPIPADFRDDSYWTAPASA